MTPLKTHLIKYSAEGKCMELLTVNTKKGDA